MRDNLKIEELESERSSARVSFPPSEIIVDVADLNDIELAKTYLSGSLESENSNGNSEVAENSNSAENASVFEESDEIVWNFPKSPSSESTVQMNQPVQAIPPFKYRRGTASISLRNRFSGINRNISNWSEASLRQEATKKVVFMRRTTRTLSSIYAVFLIVLGGVIYVRSFGGINSTFAEGFNIIVCGLGMFYLLFFNWDLFHYKKHLSKGLKEAHQQPSEQFRERINTTSSEISSLYKDGLRAPPYRFLLGRHSGSFYLKIGMAVFCFGHMVHEGLKLTQEVMFYVDKNETIKTECANPVLILCHSSKIIYSFYELFVLFKYSNIIINKYQAIARFGIIHCLATSICFWFGTVIEHTFHEYHIHYEDFFENDTATPDFVKKFICYQQTPVTDKIAKLLPYMYPFTIEYNLTIAGIWYIIWQNIGKIKVKSHPHHFRHKLHLESDSEEVVYESNVVINVDCHASNKGLFGGICLLIIAIVTIILYFFCLGSEAMVYYANRIHEGQVGFLGAVSLILVIIAFTQTHKLDFHHHPITLLDDVLLFIPLPFFFIHAILTVKALAYNDKYVLLGVYLLYTLQVVVQTPFIIDGLRRCSNSAELRFKKPGREIITFLIICNITMWIVNTFEMETSTIKQVPESHFSGISWMFIGRANNPLMLFYRFHSSVCLADIWKTAYEKEQ